MKKMIIVLLSMAIATGASAMPAGRIGGGYHGGGFAPHTTVIVRGGYSPFYSPFGYWGWGLGYGYPYPYGAVPYQPTKLDMQISNIHNEYNQRIQSVRMDHSLTGKERRQKVREFKAERNQDILNAKASYYKS